MQILIAAVGRMKSGPERELVDRYIQRAKAAGRAVSLTETRLIEIPEGRQDSAAGRKNAEAEILSAKIPSNAIIVLLDEKGKSVTSADFANRVLQWRDASKPSVAFVIGGADGLGDGLRARADWTIAFGAMTWPHQLARVMLAEQIYRTITIASGHPYHRA